MRTAAVGSLDSVMAATLTPLLLALIEIALELFHTLTLAARTLTDLGQNSPDRRAVFAEALLLVFGLQNPVRGRGHAEFCLTHIARGCVSSLPSALKIHFKVIASPFQPIHFRAI